MIKECLICRKEFYITPFHVKKGRGKFCSKKCHGIACTKRINKNCLFCGKVIELSPAFIKRGDGKYCSIKCFSMGRTKKIEIFCKTCKKKFYTKPNRIKSQRGKYCSRKCYDIGHRGNKSCCWKGGITTKSGRIVVYAPNHPFCVDRHVFRYRLAMEKSIGRYLEPQEVVHHINGNKTDDRIANLMLFPNNREHSRFHRLKLK